MTTSVPIFDAASVSEARQLVRRRGEELQLDEATLMALATAASELAQNQLDHAQGGEIAVHAIARDGQPGLEVVAADRGPGIDRPARALGGGYSTRGGLGSGLSGARRLSHEMDL